MSPMFSFDEKNIYYHILYNLIKTIFLPEKACRLLSNMLI